MDKDELISEFMRISEAFERPDQELELDIQKVINQLRADPRLPRTQILGLEVAIHGASELAWISVTDMPDPGENYQPREIEIEFFRKLIAGTHEGVMWETPSTGQRYRISHAEKTFTLVRDTNNDKDDWHTKNRVILKMLGWTMIDTKTTLRGYQALHFGWRLVVMDFAIDMQENPLTPGINFPPGSRGQEAIATHNQIGAHVRLGPRIGRYLIKYALPEFGRAKSAGAGEIINEK